MKLPFCLLACTAVVLSATAKLVNPPTDVVLIYPVEKVNPHNQVTLGYAWNAPTVFGLSRNVTLSLTYPNKTNSVISTQDTGDCFSTKRIGPFENRNNVWVNDTGMYVL
jgi:hypothetical protein